eukprot:gene7740-biopygen17512
MLERVRILNAPRGVGLAGLPPSLRCLEVRLMPALNYPDESDDPNESDDPDESDDPGDFNQSDDSDITPEVEGLTDLPMSAALSALSALTQLEEAVLDNFPDTSLPAFKFCNALRSLHLNNWT